jgi:NAD(P)-dependent dehydrogenase (short-subunit alcohol dehydrogenase family)
MSGERRLSGRVAVVAGASRGAGRGIALALGDAGAKVYVAGRTTRESGGRADGLPGTIEATAEAVTARGGEGITVQADLSTDAGVAALFERIDADGTRVDIAANAVWGAVDGFTTLSEWMSSMARPFWEQEPGQWARMMDAGARAYWSVSVHAARRMVQWGSGLIVGVVDGLVSDDGRTPGDYHGQLLWDLAHVCMLRLLCTMAIEGRAHGIAVVPVMPGFMRTEVVEKLVSTDDLKQRFGYERSESTEYIGRAVAGLAADPAVLEKSGRVQWVADLAEEYGFTDVDGRRIPRFDPFA